MFTTLNLKYFYATRCIKYLSLKKSKILYKNQSVMSNKNVPNKTPICKCNWKIGTNKTNSMRWMCGEGIGRDNQVSWPRTRAVSVTTTLVTSHTSCECLLDKINLADTSCLSRIWPEATPYIINKCSTTSHSLLWCQSN